MNITIKQARRINEVVSAGLCSGIGNPNLGEMCAEAAVCYALGLPHGDKPECVSPAVRSFVIGLNDCGWSSNEARANGMRALVIAQLGSAGKIDEMAFAEKLAELTIRRCVPEALRAAAKRNPLHSEALESAAFRCENEGTKDAADAAADAAYAAAYAAARAAAARDRILAIVAQIGVDALRHAGSPGIKLMEKLCPQS